MSSEQQKVGLFKSIWQKWHVARNLKKLKYAFKVVESAGFFVCNIQQRGGVNYLVDGNGMWHRIGKKE